MAESAREIIFEALIKCEKEKIYSNVLIKDILDKYSYLDMRDKSLIKRIFDGCIERSITLDYIINQFSKVGINKMKPPIRVILRMGIYQIIYMDGIPDSAAINEAVKLSKSHGLSNLSGFVNGVLRSICRNKDDIKYPDKNREFEKYLSVVYSVPDRLLKLLITEMGSKNAEDFLKNTFLKSSICVRGNLSRISDTELFKMLSEDDCIESVERGPIAGSYYLFGVEGLMNTKAFSEGFINVQDLSSQLAVLVSGINDGSKVLDLCAAPGGKSIAALDMGGEVISCDISEYKTEKISENIDRCGLSKSTVIVNDATVFNPDFEGQMDVVICDVPCSGLGVIKKKSDIKYNFDYDGLISLRKLQLSIIDNAVRYVKPGGTLIYSTCTILKAENEERVGYIVDKGFKPCDFSKELPDEYRKDTSTEGYLQLYGTEGDNDGFFISKFIRL